jgi:hypothetical protein
MHSVNSTQFWPAPGFGSFAQHQNSEEYQEYQDQCTGTVPVQFSVFLYIVRMNAVIVVSWRNFTAQLVNIGDYD